MTGNGICSKTDINKWEGKDELAFFSKNTFQIRGTLSRLKNVLMC